MVARLRPDYGGVADPTEESAPLQLIADSVLGLAGADVAILVLPSDSREMLHVVVAAGNAPDQLKDVEYPKAKSLVESALQTAAGFEWVGLKTTTSMFSSAKIVRLSAAMAVPMLGASGPHGAIIVGRRPGRYPFGAAELEWLKPSPIRPLSRRSAPRISPEASHLDQHQTEERSYDAQIPLRPVKGPHSAGRRHPRCASARWQPYRWFQRGSVF
jgi:hypothetical protein